MTDKQSVLLSDIVKSIEELQRKSAGLQQRLAAKTLSKAKIDELDWEITKAEKEAVGAMITPTALLKNALHFIEQEIIKAEHAA
jgi:uncharacterized protein (DUF3084 family)